MGECSRTSLEYRNAALAALRPALELVTPPTLPLLTLHEARTHLRVELDEDAPHHDDDLIKALVAAVTGELDGPFTWFGRALRPQTWALTLAAFPSVPVPLPAPPLLEVEKVEFINGDGEWETVPAGRYIVRPGPFPLKELRLKQGETWPTLGDYPLTGGDVDDAVRITYRAGYEDPEADALPASDFELVRAVAKLRLGFLYENRESVVVGTMVTQQPGVADMLENLRSRTSGVFR